MNITGYINKTRVALEDIPFRNAITAKIATKITPQTNATNIARFIWEAIMEYGGFENQPVPDAQTIDQYVVSWIWCFGDKQPEIYNSFFQLPPVYTKITEYRQNHFSVIG